MAKTPNEQTVTFFTPWQIYVASCLGSPLAAAWFVTQNHRALRQPEQVSRAVLGAKVSRLRKVHSEYQ
jgi:hypothetical protein